MDHRLAAGWRAAAIAGAVIFFALFVAQWTLLYQQIGLSNVGTDWNIYRSATERWLAGGTFYLDRQLHGPYQIVDGDVLYPPVVLALLIPVVHLPGILWWAIPLVFTAAVVVYHRPSPGGWLLIAFCLWFPITGVKLMHGNPGMWIMAAVAGGTVAAWPAALVLVKPTLLPFALIGANRRSWWITVAILAALSVLFLPMWLEYIRVLLDARSDLGLLYSLNEVLMISIPVIAWVTSRRSRPSLGWLAAARLRLRPRRAAAS